jgi:hypothetical protein
LGNSVRTGNSAVPNVTVITCNHCSEIGNF